MFRLVLYSWRISSRLDETTFNLLGENINSDCDCLVYEGNASWTLSM